MVPEFATYKQSNSHDNIATHWLVKSFMYIFSSAVFEENDEVLSWRHRRWHHAKFLTLPNISVMTEYIYLKLRLVVHY